MKRKVMTVMAAMLLTLTAGLVCPANETESPTYQADVVVIGAGGAGMDAAITASDEGASVILLEQMNYAGGNTVRAEGGMNAAETVTQKAQGIEDSVESMIEDTMAGGKQKNDPELVRYLAEHSAETIDWLTSLGMDMSDVAQGAGAAAPRTHRSAGGAKIGSVLVPVLLENLQERNIPILYQTKATELLTEDGKITGVKAVDKNGQELVFRANAVVIATGGFGANEEMIVSYRPDLAGFKTTNHPGANGSGILLAQAVGADTVDMDQIQTNPTAEVTTTTVISETVRGNGAIFLNQEGKRFVNEMLTRDVLSEAILSLPEKYTYLVFDQNTFDSMKALQENYENGIVTKGETIEELAGLLDIDADTMKASLEQWNDFVAAKNDEEFGRDTGMDADLSQAPYYAIKVAPAVHHTMGGIKINTLTEVIDVDGNVIPGLYAAGEVTGGVHGANRLGGNAITDINVFGRQAGLQASAYAATKESLPLIAPVEGEENVRPLVEGDYQDGVYSGTGTGKNGEIPVTVTVENGNITQIDIGENEETAGIFEGVERDLLPEIIQNQSTDVQAIAGATLSSNGVIEGVSQALEQAD